MTIHTCHACDLTLVPPRDEHGQYAIICPYCESGPMVPVGDELPWICEQAQGELLIDTYNEYEIYLTADDKIEWREKNEINETKCPGRLNK